LNPRALSFPAGRCKNTRRVSLDDVAKEVGLTHFLKSNVMKLKVLEALE
jgi:hypothetical protein